MGIHIHHDTLSGSEQTAVTDYAAQVANVAERAARDLYYFNNYSGLTTVKFKRWYDTAFRFISTRRQSTFMPAIYGYAVEEYVNLSIASGNPSVPTGYRVRLQVTQGGTRPDIVIYNSSNTEIAWMDITNQSSKGHIFNKAGNWQDGRSFIAELLYPDFDASKISSGTNMGARVAAESIIRQAAIHERGLMSHLAQKMNDVLSELTERIRRGAIIYQPDVAECVERKFGVTFPSNYKHPIIKSMLQLYINCSDANRKSDARDCLSGLYGSTGQDKAAAVSYIEESKSTLDPYIYY
ncbi:MAG: hypothetical protein K2J11_06870 [Oscillospiraceae bacterium]|nr:hypothetical protein [Oscillospiraceae bacterium]